MRNHPDKHLFLAAVIVLAACSVSNITTAQQEPDFEIPKTHIEVRVVPPDAVPKPDLLSGETPGAADPVTPEDPMKALHQELETVRDELRMLQATLDLMINQIMADLRNENVLLRKEVQRLNSMQAQYGLPDISLLPRPGMELFEEIVSQEYPPDPDATDVQNSPQPEDVVEENSTDEPFAFTKVHEWGRSPELAGELGDDIPSLLGLVGVVPRNSRRADIEQLGRDLRNQYDAYDNINIEVFDDFAAAEKFVDTQVGDPERRVLSVSKHSAARRDVILFLKNGEAHEVAR